MTQKEIDILLDKFEAGNCSAVEEQLVESILDAQAEEMGDIYSAFLAEEQSTVFNENTATIIKAESGELDVLLDAQSSEMGEVYNEYVASAKSKKSSVDVELLIQAADGTLEQLIAEQEMGEGYNQYVSQQKSIKSTTDVELLLQAEDGTLEQLIAEQEMGEVYNQYVSQQKLIKSTTDVELLIQSHTGGLDELLSQQEQAMDAEYKEFISTEKNVTTTLTVEEALPKKEEAKVIPLGSQWKKYRGIAAVLVAVVAAVFLLNTSSGWDEGQYADGLSADERIEAELALEQTLAALGIANNKFNKGTDNMKGLKNLKHTEIFK